MSYISMTKKIGGTYWLSLLINRDTAMCFVSCGIKYLSQDVLNQIEDKSINHNIFRK